MLFNMHTHIMFVELNIHLNLLEENGLFKVADL